MMSADEVKRGGRCGTDVSACVCQMEVADEWKCRDGAMKYSGLFRFGKEH